MKKNGLIITILLIIVLIHAVTLFCCVGTGRWSSKKASAAVTHTGKTGPTQAPKPAAPTLTPAQLKYMEARRNLGKPFDYKYAYYGDLRKFPGAAQCKAGILVDIDSRRVLWAKNPRKSVPIASMTKIMTVLLAYEDTLTGRDGVRLTTPVQVTREAYKIGGSQVYLDPKETFPLSDLLRAASIQSANDAAYLIAQSRGNGSVGSFVERMNSRAMQLGMTGTHYNNPHGLPEKSSREDNLSTPEDMVKLAEACMLYPQLVAWASTVSSPFRQQGVKGFIMMRNHNHLLPGMSEATTGVNGLKTGFIQRSGFCLTVTADRGGHRLIGVVMGFPTRRERDRFVRQLVNWGYDNLQVKAPGASAAPSVPDAPAVPEGPSVPEPPPLPGE